MMSSQATGLRTRRAGPPNRSGSVRAVRAPAIAAITAG
jgi:hypothetical protein